MIIGSGITIDAGIRMIEESSVVPVVTTGLQLYLDAGNASSQVSTNFEADRERFGV